MTTRGIRLDWKPLFISSAIIAFLIRQMMIFNMLLRFRMPLDHRIRILFFRPWAAPRSVVYGIFIAASITIVFQLLVTLVIAPLIRAWHRPRADGSAGLFRLEAGEQILDTLPGRRLNGNSWVPGTLIRSNRSIWFIPEGWDAEPWTLPLHAIRSLALEPSSPLAWGFVSGLPDRVLIEDQDGRAFHFAVGDPQKVAEWFETRITAVA